MIQEKYSWRISITCLSLSVILILSYLFAAPENKSAASVVAPKKQVLNKDKVTEINIIIKDSDWKWLLENPSKEEYRSANITINGETFNNVGVRPKGNSSLMSVASDPDSDRFSLKVDFSQYVKGQTYHGFEKLALNNMMSDTTYMKEYLSYGLYDSLGVPVPEYSYSNIKLNGKDWGLYLAVEVIEENFVERVFGSSEGNLYKPESAEMGGGMPFGNSSKGGSDLKFIDDKLSSYPAIRKGAVFKTTTDKDFEKVVIMIKNLKEGTKLEENLDVEGILKYFAVNTFLVNLDSYSGGMYHNYYLFEKEGVFSIMPWDLNMSFAGFSMTLGFGEDGAKKAINFPIDAPVTGNLEDAPLIGNLLKVDKYKELYHSYLRKIVDEYIKVGVLENSVAKTDKLIENYVKSDPTAFYSFDEYKKSIPELIAFGRDRALSVSSQLSGAQPSDSYGNIETKINLSSLGVMQMGGQKLGEGGQMPAMGNRVPGMGGGMPNMGAMPPQENMMQIISIISKADINNLTEQEKQKLKALGVNDEMLANFKNMPQGEMPPMGFAMGGTGNPMTLIFQGLMLVIIIPAGLIFVKKVKRKKIMA